MKILQWVVLLMTGMSALHAQNTLFGRVFDSKTKEPIPGVSVYIQGGTKGTMTDNNGDYQINTITSNIITVVYSYTGYQEQKQQVTFDIPRKEVTVFLQEQVFELDEVILSTPFNKLQSENVVKVSYKSLASMQKDGVQNIMDGITQISGVSQQSTGAGISKPVIRGLTGNRVLVYNQGVRLENFQFGEEHGLGIDESGISGIEVIKGPASLLYGSDAMGGVLYLVPEKYALTGKNQAELTTKYTSNTSGIYTNLGYKISGNKLQVLLRGAYNRQADYRIPKYQSAVNSRYNDSDIKLGIGYKTDLFTTDIRYNYNTAANGLSKEKADGHADSYKPKGPYQQLDNQYVSMKNKWTLPHSSIQTNFGYTAHKRVLIVNESPKIGMQLNTFNYDLKWYLPKYHKLESIIGVQGMEQNNRNFGQSYLLPDADISNIGFFSSLNYALSKISFQGGIRYDFRHITTQNIGQSGTPEYRPGFDKTLDNFTAALGAKTTINNHTLRLNIASGFRAPNLAELTSKGQHDSRIEIGNNALENEKNIQTDIAYEIETNHLEFFINAFYNAIDNYIFLAPTGTTQDSYAVYQYQQNNAQLYGGEIGLHFHPHPLDWLHIESSYERVTGILNNGDYLPLIPANQWKNKMRLTNNFNESVFGKVYFNISINHTIKADKVSEFEDESPAYTLVNTGTGLTMKWHKTTVDFNLSVHNLMNKEYISHMSVLKEDAIPNMGRNFLISARVKI